MPQLELLIANLNCAICSPFYVNIKANFNNPLSTEKKGMAFERILGVLTYKRLNEFLKLNHLKSLEENIESTLKSF